MKRIVSAIPGLLSYALPIGLIAIVVLFVLPATAPRQTGFFDNTFQNIVVEPSAVPTTPPCLDPQDGDIAFESLADGNWDIFLVNTDGTGLCNLTRDPDSDYGAQWSPDGTRLAFESTRDDKDGKAQSPNTNIYVAAIEDMLRGVPPLRVSNGLENSRPSWSPDGKRIAFYSMVDGRWGLYVANADGSNPIRVMDELDYFDSPAVWSPTDSGSNSPFCMVDLTGLFQDWGGAPMCLTIATPAARDWSWAPDGGQVAFVTTYEFWVASRDGSERRNLAQGTGRFSDLDWSPDGRQIAFIHDAEREANYNVYVVNPDGTGMRRLTYTDGQDFNPRWSPDGRYLVYKSHNSETDLITHSNDHDIYLLDVISGQQTQLTHHLSNDTAPQWRPRPAVTLPLPSPAFEASVTSTDTPSPEPALTATATVIDTETPDGPTSQTPTATPAPTGLVAPNETSTPGPTGSTTSAWTATPL